MYTLDPRFLRKTSHDDVARVIPPRPYEEELADSRAEVERLKTVNQKSKAKAKARFLAGLK